MRNIISQRFFKAFNGGAMLAVPVIVAGLIITLFLGPAMERIYIVFLINLIVVIGMGVYCGNTGILSFGHLSFMAIGAYLSGVLTISVTLKELSLPMLPGFLKEVEIGIVPAILVVIIAVILFAWVTGKILSKLDGSSAGIATLGLLVIVHGTIIAAREFTRGSQSFFGVPRDTSMALCLVAAGIAIIAGRLFRDCLPGLQARAARDDIAAARSIGIDTKKRTLQAWILSGVIVAVAGVLLGHFLGTFSPKKFYFVDTFALLAMLIIGGMESTSGAIFGTALITIVSEFLRRLEPGISLFNIRTPEIFGTTQIGIGLVILFVMYFRPNGLLGRFEIDKVIKRRKKAKPPEAHGHYDFQRVMGYWGDDDGRIEARDIVMNFSGLKALDRVKLTLRTNEIIGLIGPNGSGKTTLLNILSGTLECSGGCVFIDGRDVTRMPSQEIARLNVSRTFQNIKLFSGLTVKEHIEVAAISSGTRADEKAFELITVLLEFMGLDREADRLAVELPYGLQRKVEIARALALKPKFLMLDEPAAGMNSQESRQLMKELLQLKKKIGIGILIIDHDMDMMMDLCDRLIVLNEGKPLALGTPKEIKNNPDVIEAYMGRKQVRSNTNQRRPDIFKMANPKFN